MNFNHKELLSFIFLR